MASDPDISRNEKIAQNIKHNIPNWTMKTTNGPVWIKYSFQVIFHGIIISQKPITQFKNNYKHKHYYTLSQSYKAYPSENG